MLIVSRNVKQLSDRYADDYPAIEANIKLDGVPRDLESAQALANRSDDKIQIVTVDDILAGAKLTDWLPMARTDAVKSAAALGDADKQAQLL